MSEMKSKEQIIKEWTHFCKCINFGGSFLDAQAIQFMNEFPNALRELKTEPNKDYVQGDK